MKLFYTVTSKKGNIQSKPELSLGGFCSSSEVSNGSFGNLFSEISLYSLQKPKAEYIGLILKNTFEESFASLKFWMNVPDDSLCKFRIAVVGLDKNGQMEMVPSVNSKPLYAEFEETSEQDPIEIESQTAFAPGQMLGVWIERTINTDSDQYKQRNSCDYLFGMFERKETWPTEENVSLNIDFVASGSKSFNRSFNRSFG